MATLDHTIDIQPTTPNPDFEPEEEWKTNLIQRIEDTLKPAAEKLKRELTEKLKGLSPPEDSKAHIDYDNAMIGLRRTANEQYRQLLERERQERRWAAGEKVDEKWSEILMKEQQALLDMYKKGSMPKTNQSEATRDEERGQPPPSAKAPDRVSLPPESIARDRMRRPSNILTEPIPEDSPPTRTSLEDRDPRPYSSTGSWSRRSNGRDRSASFGSPPRPAPEIWKPASNESTTSRTLAHATGGTTKPRRDSSASIGTTSSFPATIPEDASLGADKDQDSEKLWSGIFRSRQKSRKGSASVDDRVTVAQLFPELKRDDSAITTSPLTPDSPYGIARHPSYTMSSGRPIMNSRRSFTDEPRQPSRWYPPPQTSDPRPIKSKSSFRADDDGGFPFQPSSPGSGPWNTRSSLEETAPIYPTSSPQDEYRPWKIPSSKPGSIRSRSSINSLRYRPPMAHQPSKHYPDDEESISDTEDDSEEDWKQRLEAEFSRRESNAKQMEEEVMRRREEARKKEVELKAKEAETKRREDELNRKEEEAMEEARRKDEELRQKEEELLRKEEEALRKEEEVLAKEEEVRLKEEDARRLAEDAEKREEDAKLMEEEARRKEEDARQREREAKKRVDEAKRKEEEARRKEEAARLREEDARKKVEEARKKEAELRKKEWEAKRLEEDAKQKEEEARQVEEEARKREEELERKEDEMRQLSELVEQKEEDARRKEDEARLKEEEARRKEDDIRKREREIRRKEDVLKRREKELQDREVALQTREQQEEEDRRVKQEAADSEAILQEGEVKQKEDELEKREAELERREAKVREEERLRQEEADRLAREEEEEKLAREKQEEERAREEAEGLAKEAERLAKEEEERLAQEEADRLAKLEAEQLASEEADRLAKETERQKREQRRLEREAVDRRREENVRLEQEREEAKRKEREERRKEAERKQRDGAGRQREGSDRKKREEETEQKRREEERLKAEQLEADHLAALKLSEEWRQEDLRARNEEARRAEAKLKEVQRKDEARRSESGGSDARFREEQRKLEAQRQRWKTSDDPRRRTESSASYMSTSSTMPLSESPTKSGAAWSSASSQWTSPNGSTRPTSTSSSQGPIPVRTPTMSTSAGRSSTGGWSANGAGTSGTSPYQTTSMSPEEWEKRQQDHARKQQEQFRREQEQFRREQERKERERQARTSKTLSEKEIVALFAEHDRQWTRLKTLDDLGWDSFPWPMFKKPTEPEELTSVAIGAYVLSPHHPTEKSKGARDRVKDHIKKWHPDRFETKLLRKVREEEREKVREGAGLVARNLNEMLTRSNILDAFS